MTRFMLIVSCLVSGLSISPLVNAQENKASVQTHELKPLTEGTVSPDVLDVTTMPSLALPLSVQEQEAAKSSDSEQAGISGERKIGVDILERSGPVVDASTGVNCATPQGPPLPNGWTVTYMGNVATCSYPFTSGYYSICLPGGACFNQYTFTSFYDVPVGNSMRYCSAIGVPAGWQVTQINLPASCPGSGQDSVMQHVSCISGRDTNCYPQSASITASPQTLVVPYGQSAGSTTINWNTVNYSNPCIWVRNNGGTTQLWACSGGGAHSGVWPYVPSGGTTTLWISDGGSASSSPNVAQVVVTGQQGIAPTITASPNVVNIPAGQSGSTSISYNLAGSGYAGMCIWIQNTGGPAKVWGCTGSTTYTATWPYVPKGGTTTLWLSPSQTSSTPVLATVVVTGQ